MPSKLVIASVGLGIFVLFIALVFPTLISAPTSDMDHTNQLNESDTEEIRDRLLVTLDDVNQGGGEATVTVADIDSGETDQATVAENESVEMDLPGGNVSVTLESLESSSEAIVTVSHESTYGWSDGAALLVEQFGILLAIVAFLFVLALFYAIVTG